MRRVGIFTFVFLFFILANINSVRADCNNMEIYQNNDGQARTNELIHFNVTGLNLTNAYTTKIFNASCGDGGTETARDIISTDNSTWAEGYFLASKSSFSNVTYSFHSNIPNATIPIYPSGFKQVDATGSGWTIDVNGYIFTTTYGLIQFFYSAVDSFNMLGSGASDLSAIGDDNVKRFKIDIAPSSNTLQFNGSVVAIVNVSDGTRDVRYVFSPYSPFARVEFYGFTPTANDGFWFQSNKTSGGVQYRNSTGDFIYATGADLHNNAYGMWMQGLNTEPEMVGMIWDLSKEPVTDIHTYARFALIDDPQTCGFASGWCDGGGSMANMIGNLSHDIGLKIGIMNLSTLNETYYREANPLQMIVGNLSSDGGAGTSLNISILFPPDGNINNTNTITFGFNATNANTITLYGNFSGTWSANETNSTSDTITVTIPDGVYLWGFKAQNSTDYIFTENRTLKIDSIAPSMTIQSPLNRTYNTTDIWFNITASSNADTCMVDYGLSNVTMTNSSGNYNYNDASVSQGVHIATFYCNNSVGMWNSNAITFTIDSMPPNITIQSPINPTYYNTALIWFNITLNENGNTCFVNYSSGNIPMTNSSGNWHYSTTLSNGAYTPIFSCNDTAGNSNIANGSTFNIINPPTPPIIDPSSITGQLVTLGFGIMGLFAVLTLLGIGYLESTGKPDPETIAKIMIGVVIIILMIVAVWTGIVTPP